MEMGVIRYRSINKSAVSYRKKTVRIELFWEIRRVSIAGFM